MLISDETGFMKALIFKDKLEQTVEFLKKNFSNQEGFLGSAYDADSEGEEGKYYVYNYEQLKNIKNIEKFLDIKPAGNWEGKIILDELKEPSEEIIANLLKINTKTFCMLINDPTIINVKSKQFNKEVLTAYREPCS